MCSRVKVNLGTFGQHVGDNNRYVVGCTKLKRLANQQLGGLFGGYFREQNALKHLIGHHPAEPVAAEHPAVSGSGLVDRHVDLGHTLHVTQNAHQHAAPGVHQRLLGGDFAKLNQALHKGVVCGDLLHAAIAGQVDARVADVRGYHAVLVQQHAAEGGAHALKFGVLDHGLHQHRVGLKNAAAQAVYALLNGVVALVAQGDALRGDGRCDVTAGVPTHAVGHKK